MTTSDKIESEEASRFRQPKGAAGKVAKTIFIVFPILGTIYVLHLLDLFDIQIYKEQYLGMFLSLMLASSFIVSPATKKGRRDHLPWYDALLSMLGFIGGSYISIFYQDLILRVGYIDPVTLVFGVITIALVIEAARRLFGLPLLFIGVFFVLYAHYAYLFPGFLNARKISWARVVTFLYLDPNSLLGVPLDVAGIIVFAFIFFGHVLFGTGGGKFLTDLALSTVGKFTGGAAKGAVVGSALFGTLSGSAAANVALTGSVTIPLMKGAGFKPHFAAAVEAVASTGGLIMPPVMAATAFILAEFLDTSYSIVVARAAIPAVLYYLAVFLQVHIEAVHLGIKGLPRQELPSLTNTMREGWIFVFPVAVLIFTLFVLRFRPELSALYGIGAMLVISVFKKSTRISLRRLMKILEDTGKGVLEVGIVCALAGFVIGSTILCDLGLSMSNQLIAMSQGMVFLLLLFAAAGAIVMGMGMPITAVYVMLAVLIAPALIQLGVQPMPAHLFILYFGAMAFVTPPVCIAVFVGAGIAGSNPMRTGFTACRLGIVAYIVPFVFCYDPALLLLGSASEITLTIARTVFGILLLCSALGGYMFEDMGAVRRIWATLAGLAFLFPDLKFSLGAAILSIPLVLLQWKARRRGPGSTANSMTALSSLGSGK